MTTPTTTETEDISTRLAVLETEVRNINVQLERMHTDQQDARREQQAENRAINARIDRLQSDMTTQFSQVNSRIDRLLYAVIGVGAVALVSLIGIIANLVIALID